MKNIALLSIIFALFLVGCNKNQNLITSKNNAKIISTAPSNTEILIELGVGDYIIASDIYSAELLNREVTLIDMLGADIETLIALKPDIVIASEVNQISNNKDPYELLRSLGTEVIYIPTSNTIEDIYLSIEDIARFTKTETIGEKIIENMKREVLKIEKISDKSENKKSVYFEIDPLFTFGDNTFLNDLIKTAGGINIFQDEKGWLSVTEESILAKDPDVILTNITYIDTPIDDIKNREGWKNLNAIKNNQVFYIDQNSSSRPTHNSIIALIEISKALYPELYE